MALTVAHLMASNHLFINKYRMYWHIRPPLVEGRSPALTKFVWRTDHLYSKSPLL